MKKVIRIAGTAYSGSTMFDLMLSNSEKGFSCGEIIYLFRPHRKHHFDPVCGCGNRHCNVWRTIKDAGEECWVDNIFRMFPNTEYVVDSSKDLNWLKDQRSFDVKRKIDAKNIVIWKTPAEFALSRLKRNKLWRWKSAYKIYYHRYFSINPDWVSLKLSRLYLNPESALKRVCEVLEIDGRRGMEKYWKKEHHTLFGSNTAKAHLYERNSREYKKVVDDDQKRVKNGLAIGSMSSSSHKSIVTTYGQDLERLPKKVKEQISDDTELAEIVENLEKRDCLAEPYLSYQSMCKNEIKANKHLLRYHYHDAKRNMVYCYNYLRR